MRITTDDSVGERDGVAGIGAEPIAAVSVPRRLSALEATSALAVGRSIRHGSFGHLSEIVRRLGVVAQPW